MKQLTILSGRCLVVELPSWETIEKELSIHGHDEGLTESEFKEYVYSKCPPGNWRIIGMLSEVGEDDLTEIVVDGCYVTATHFAFINHVYNIYTCSTRIESLNSAILAEGYYLDESPIKRTQFTNPDIWDSIQSRVLDRSRCLLLGRSN